MTSSSLAALHSVLRLYYTVQLWHKSNIKKKAKTTFISMGMIPTSKEFCNILDILPQVKKNNIYIYIG